MSKVNHAKGVSYSKTYDVCKNIFNQIQSEIRVVKDDEKTHEDEKQDEHFRAIRRVYWIGTIAEHSYEVWALNPVAEETLYDLLPE